MRDKILPLFIPNYNRIRKETKETQMKRILKLSTAAGLALSLTCAPLAMAQPNDNHGDIHNNQPHNQPPMGHPGQAGATHVTPLPTHPEMSSPMHGPMAPAVPEHAPAPPHVTHENVHQNVTVHENTHVTQMAHPGGWQAGHQYDYHGHPMPHVGFSGHYWQHGQHFSGHRYVVNNWQYYDLQAPPAGYEWVQDGSQFVLVAIASGIIASVIIGAMNQ